MIPESQTKMIIIMRVPSDYKKTKNNIWMKTSIVRLFGDKKYTNKLHLTSLIAFVFVFVLADYAVANTAKTGMRNITSSQLVADMGAGFNLGNTMDSKCADLSAEICWGNPYTTQAMIDKFAARGFKTMRLPVTWEQHMGAAPNYTIDPDWLNRVEEIANYAFKNDMYVIINTHHEGAWIKPTNADRVAVTDRLTKLWTQIATRFKDYGDYLIFETLNEPRLEGSAEEWNGGTAEGRDCVNQFHKAAVDAIRATGGNNTLRHIMVCPYAASTNPTAMSAWVAPNNDPRIIVSVHSYFPWLYCLETQTNWGTATEYSNMDAQFNTVYNAFASTGHPIVMGEWGATNHNIIADRLKHGAYYVKKCREKGICPIYWDNGKASEFGLLNRNTLAWDFPQYADTIVNARKYKQCTSSNQKAYISVNDGAYQEITSVSVNRGDKLKLKVEFTVPNTAKWFLPDGTSTSTNELIINNTQFANAGVYAYVPTSTAVCNSSTSLGVGIKIYQAEDFVAQNGISTETTTDAGGGLNIGYIQDGDWSSYTIPVTKTGIYRLSVRVATNSLGGEIECSVGGVLLGKILVEDSKSNGWQDWYTTDFTELLLNAGTTELKFTYKGSSSYLFNINWFDLVFYQDVHILHLNQGWNIISTYITNNTPDISKMFPNASLIKTDYSFYSKGQPAFLNTLQKVEAGIGYLIYNTASEDVTIVGTNNQTPVRAINQGWNLVGIPSTTSLPLSTYPSVQIIKNFDGFYEPGNTMSNITDLEVGKAYYILK